MSSFSSSSGNQESESRSNPNPKRIYDVFLSFCGKDIGESFTSHFCTALTNAGVNVFWHYDELRSGDQISPTQLQAIERFRISVIVFSTNYANSRWCLQELEKIIECCRIIGQEVLPVFYDVDPSDVSEQRGIFGKAFEDLIRGILVEEDEVMSWRAALREASNISRFVEMDSRNESLDIKNVVEHVSHLLELTDLFVAKHPVGVKSRVQDVLQLLNYHESKDVLLLGIWGMGGIGKTTIAKAIYNEIGRDFEGRSFLPHISKVWNQDDGQDYLKKQLLFDISKTTKTKINDIASREIMLKKILSNKRVLIVLDDVSEFDQLDALCESREWFGPGSIIIITSRYLNPLRSVGLDHLYEMEFMDIIESVELFSWHAFKQAFPIENFVGLSRNICKIIKGVPIALEVLGSFLFDRKKEQWDSVFDYFKKTQHDLRHYILTISFEGLEQKEKEIFLEITCFFIGMHQNDVIQKLNDCGHFPQNGVGALVDRSLVTVDEKNKLGMHDLLEEMGRNIIFQKSGMEPGSRMYDVFLSFRGEDTRATFTSHLYTSLQNAGIYVFRDDDEIQRGDQVSISLLQAIGRSSISVIVLSRNYANSRWCMLELESILESRRTNGLVVVPVFYGVDPSEICNQTGMFGQAFKDLIRRISMKEDKKRSWKKALLEVGGIAGFVIRESRNESEDIKKVVEHVTRLLDRTYLFVAEHPVGVESRVQDVIKLLNSQQSTDPLVLGIWGMGGIGKTTIAKAIYNQIGRKFENRSFLLNVREVWEQDNGGVHLQKQLLSDIYKTMKIEIHNIELGKSILKQRLGQKRVLLVLDDVDKSEQLNALFGSHKWFAPESIIIITTRDEHVLSERSVDPPYIMKNMDEKESIEFFSWHAFKQASPQEEFATLSSNVIAYSGGLPLALEVLGSYLFGREIKEWESVLEQLKSIPNDQVQKKLKISFDGLSNSEKEIFLDVAFFLIGMDRNDAVDILNGCGLSVEIGVSVLVERSLITIDGKNKLRMHDLLRDMGREIIREKSPREPEERSRLWHPEEVLDVLSKDMGRKAVQGLALKLPRMNACCLKTIAFKKMKRLRLLQLAGVQLDGDFKYLSRDLRWLSWHGFPSTYTPADFDQGSLVAIDLKYSNLQLVWKKGQLLKNLKILNLSHSRDLTQTPDFLNLPNLEKLILKDCTSLSSVSHTIGHLNRLLLINLKGCRRLRELPRSIYELKSLKTLILSGCLMIDKMEEDLEKMESLATLIADNTAITRVPFSIVRSKSIGYISLCGYEGFSRDVFPSIIWSWMSPTNNLSSLVQTSADLPSFVFLDVPNSSSHCISFMLNDLPKLRSLWVKCGSELQLTRDEARILGTLDATFCKELKATATSTQVSNMKTSTSIHCRIGNQVDKGIYLTDSIFQKPTTSGPADCFLPGDKSPYWFNFNGEGPSVIFDVPQVIERKLKAITLGILYSASPDIISEGLKILVINHTKITIQLYKRDTLILFEDEEWQRVVSSLEPGNRVRIVVFGNGFSVKKTAVYLIYNEPIDQIMEHCLTPGPRVTFEEEEFTKPLKEKRRISITPKSGKSRGGKSETSKSQRQAEASSIMGNKTVGQKPPVTTLSHKKSLKDQEIQDTPFMSDAGYNLASPQIVKASTSKEPNLAKNMEQVAESLNVNLTEKVPIFSPRNTLHILDLSVEETTPALDKRKAPMEVDILDPTHDSDEDPFAELESILSGSHRSPRNSIKSSFFSIGDTSIKEALINLECLLKNSLSSLLQDQERCRQLQIAVDCLDAAADDLPVEVVSLVKNMKIVVPNLLDRFPSSQEIVNLHINHLDKKKSLSQNTSDTKHRHELLITKISEGSSEAERLDLEIAEVRNKLDGLVKKQEKLVADLQKFEIEKKKLRDEARQKIQESKEVMSAIESSEPNYKAALKEQAGMKKEWELFGKRFADSIKSLPFKWDSI